MTNSPLQKGTVSQNRWMQAGVQIFSFYFLIFTPRCVKLLRTYYLQGARWTFGDLDQVFIKHISVLCSVQLSLNYDQSPSPCLWITPAQHEAATTMLHGWDALGQVLSGACFPPDMTLRIETKQFNHGLLRSENLVSHSLSPLHAILQTPSRLPCVFHWGEFFVWPLCHKAQTSGVLQWLLSFWNINRRSTSTQHLCRSTRVTIRFLVTSWQFGRAASSKKNQFKNYGGHCALGNLQCSNIVLVAFPRSVPPHNPVFELCTALCALPCPIN